MMFDHDEEVASIVNSNIATREKTLRKGFFFCTNQSDEDLKLK